ncbi:MAG TPA: hypothetical protein VMW45_00260, partial [Dehalococcoidia bacterium]|nr:hypothetical protein [Dehalococcoidia bacterium]
GAIRGLGDLDKGFKKIDSSAKGSSSSISSFDKSLDTAFKSITALNQGIQLAKAAYNAFAGAIKTATDAYAVQEKSQLGLINTLKLQGQFTQAAIKDFTDFANKLQETTTVGDEVTLSFLKTAKAMGLSNDQAKEAVKAAANLSAATGKDLNSAFQQVLKTFSGFAGELGEALPAIKDLTNAQRKAGEATKIVNQQLGGEAEALANTFGGSNLKRANALGDVLEQIGQTFVEVFDLTAVNKDMTAFFQDMISQVKVFRATLLAVDFKKLQIELEKIGTTLSVVILPVLIRMATPLALVALKFTAIAVAVGAIVVVIDLLVRNMKNLGSVGAVVLDGLKVAWTNFNITVIKGWELIANAG